jgi:hypothetical protein
MVTIPAKHGKVKRPAPSRNGHGTMAARLRSMNGCGGAEKLPEDKEWELLSDCLLEATLKQEMKSPFPLWVFPKAVQNFINANVVAIPCSPALIAVPLLAVAGAAIGRAGKRLLVKGGWSCSSCLWTICLAQSSDGKSPALSAADCWYTDEHRRLHDEWVQQKAASKRTKQTSEDGEVVAGEEDDPCPEPMLFLTDTTTEALRQVLSQGPSLYLNDEMSAWCHQMGQYKTGNADKPIWTSAWSHKDANVGRVGGNIYVTDPFIGVAGMMVPQSAHELNYKGHADDGFIHRLLIACPPSTQLLFSPLGVDEALTKRYKTVMTRLFDPGDNLTMADDAYTLAVNWINTTHYPEVSGRAAPPWLVAKYKKLQENLWRMLIVIHGMRAAEKKGGPKFDSKTVDVETVERAIAVIEYFKEQIDAVQDHLTCGVEDDVETLYERLRSLKEITTTTLMKKSGHKTKDKALRIFADWQKRGFGKIETRNRKHQTKFRFNSMDGNAFK